MFSTDIQHQDATTNQPTNRLAGPVRLPGQRTTAHVGLAPINPI